MKNKNLIIVVAGCLMLLAYFALPYVASIKVSSFGMSHSEKVNLSLFDGLKEASTILDFLLMLLVLLAPLYLLLDVFRDKLKESVPAVEQIVIPEKVVSLLPLIFIILERLFDDELEPVANTIAQGLANFSVQYGSGFYLYLFAAIVVAVLPWIKQPILDKGKKEEENIS